MYLARATGSKLQRSPVAPPSSTPLGNLEITRVRDSNIFLSSGGENPCPVGIPLKTSQASRKIAAAGDTLCVTYFGMSGLQSVERPQAESSRCKQFGIFPTVGGVGVASFGGIVEFWIQPRKVPAGTLERFTSQVNGAQEGLTT
ncbi:hypothetical protein K438DRAFT_1767023 [Mycena galopus ATCC 62051]|nr:hypothetical protein K438DRAFT_1767023 [Mycena galopus ATCC 62051]